VSKRSGEGEDAAWVNENVGEELNGEAVTGYEANDPLARGVVRNVEGVGEGRRVVRGGGETRIRFLAAIPLVSHRLLAIYAHRVFYACSNAGNIRSREES
jgi:hypothetical protein